ncbi:MAG: AzlD domain-containing protein [Thermovirgaceae bacterium]|jgi:branched-subunit amino acid transport protein|nr:AzlD domain-containing protein [Synergistales bacterium]MDI9392270.1 AzlD domain-containing protein [Synergistota bacterium]MDY0178886.1 AzlD domain-containing protein [Synergistaceae bacterium]HRW88166.1 AzlD domain-containing protein [Thermovirgaceae bacterium]MDD3134276.1 AzlD domain-containing protein [Synergistales bacterium]
MNFYILFGVVAVALLVIKGLFLCFVPFGKIPPFFERSFRYIPPAVLAALIAPSVLYAKGPAGLEISPARLIAGIAAFAVAMKTRNILVAIATGMTLLWTFSFI